MFGLKHSIDSLTDVELQETWKIAHRNFWLNKVSDDPTSSYQQGRRVLKPLEEHKALKEAQDERHDDERSVR